jgi:hypothetical protein
MRNCDRKSGVSGIDRNFKEFPVRVTVSVTLSVSNVQQNKFTGMDSNSSAMKYPVAVLLKERRSDRLSKRSLDQDTVRLARAPGTHRAVATAVHETRDAATRHVDL